MKAAMKLHRLRWTVLLLLPLLILFLKPSPIIAQGDYTANTTDTPTPPHVAIGDIYAEAGMPDEAAGFYLKALEANPDDAQALAKLSGVLNTDEADPRIAVADAHVAAGDYASAIAIYTEILAAEPDQPELQAKAIEAATETTRLNSAWWWSLSRDWLTGVIKAVATALGIIVLLLILLGLARLVRALRERRACTGGRLFVILPFTNATATAAIKGMEQGARSAVVDWLVTRKQAVRDEADQVEEALFPDLGTAGKLLNWLAAQLTPRCPQVVADATLVYYPGRQEAGLVLTARDAPGGQIVRTRTFTASTLSGDELATFVDLAHQGASWLLDEPQTLSARAATQLHAAHQLAVWARVQELAGRATAAAEAFLAAAELAREVVADTDSRPKSLEGAPREAVAVAGEAYASSDLAAATAALFEQFAGEAVR